MCRQRFARARRITVHLLAGVTLGGVVWIGYVPPVGNNAVRKLQQLDVSGEAPLADRGSQVVVGELMSSVGVRVVAACAEELGDAVVKLGAALVGFRFLCVCGEAPLREEIHGAVSNRLVTSRNAVGPRR